MSVQYVAIATEDETSEAVVERLLAESQGRLEVGVPLRRDGFGYLRANMRKWCELARRMPVVLLTDLDAAQCASSLIADWTRNDCPPASLLFRVAVREVEAWLLADSEGMEYFMRVKLPRKSVVRPEKIDDPKMLLLRAALKAPRIIRDDIVRVDGNTLRQGLGYNVRLTEFVRDHWRPEVAATRAPSLERARRAIARVVLSTG